MFFSDGWNGIPFGSTLEIELEPQDHTASVAGSQRVTRPGGMVLQGAVTSASFPLVVPIGAGEQHIVKFDLICTGITETLKITAQVLKPDGTNFGKTVTCSPTITPQDDVFTIKLFANA